MPPISDPSVLAGLEAVRSHYPEPRGKNRAQQQRRRERCLQGAAALQHIAPMAVLLTAHQRARCPGLLRLAAAVSEGACRQWEFDLLRALSYGARVDHALQCLGSRQRFRGVAPRGPDVLHLFRSVYLVRFGLVS